MERQKIELRKSNFEINSGNLARPHNRGPSSSNQNINPANVSTSSSTPIPKGERDSKVAVPAPAQNAVPPGGAIETTQSKGG